MRTLGDSIYLLADHIQPALSGSIYLGWYAEATPDTLDDVFQYIVWDLWDTLDAEALFAGLSELSRADMLLWEDAVAVALRRALMSE